MKNLIYPSWIMVILVLFQFSCQDETEYIDLDPIPSEISNVTGLEGNWTARSVEIQNENTYLDVSEFINEFTLSISKNQSCCSLNGCGSWTTSLEWEKGDDFFCTYFKNEDSGGVMFFNIISIEGSQITALINNKTPDIKLFPEEVIGAIYRVSLVPE